MSYLIEAEVDALQLSGLSIATPYAIQGVMNTQLSIARHYGGIIYQGVSYTYFPDGDELIRDDVLQWITKRRKKIERDSRHAGAKGNADVPAQRPAQSNLFC